MPPIAFGEIVEFLPLAVRVVLATQKRMNYAKERDQVL